jgi:hypothetical protein
MDGTELKIKLDHHPLLIPNIPYFHHSIIPRVLGQQPPPLWSEINAWPSGQGLFT